MRRIAIITILCVGCHLAAAAQATFTQRVQQSAKGEGTVTITQDKAIDDLVNGPKPQVATPKQTEKKPTTTTTTATPNKETKPDTKPDAKPETKPEAPRQAAVAEKPAATPDTTTVEDGRKKVMKGGYKINGYRVQVYAGGNSRDARIKAERTGKEINALFPGEPVYVHFYSPRWICRMGNYRTYEEASEKLRSVKKLGYNSAIIVKGKITVPYLPSSPNTP